MESTPESKSEKAEKSYLSTAVDSISPWGGSRSSTPKPASATVPGEGSGLKHQRGGDHTIQNWHGFSSKRYPPDCPPMNARWFHAVDIPKRKPKLLKNTEENTKPPGVPKKFVTFSIHDSRSIETSYQKLADEYDDLSREVRQKGEDYGSEGQTSNSGKKPNTSIDEAGQESNAGGKVRVPVQEDFLFDVDIEQRELSPLYWLGPIYEVRRGSWFYQEGSTLRPCDENLAFQLEEGYLKVMPFRYPKAPEKLNLKTGDAPNSLALSGAFNRKRTGSGEITPKGSSENLRAANQQALDDAASRMKDAPAPNPHQPQSYRLFGTYMNSIVTYQDSTVAWLSVDSIMSRVSSSVYERFAGGAYLGGIKLVRGYSEGKKEDRVPTTPTSTASKGSNVPPELQLDAKQQKLLKRRSAPPSTTQHEAEALGDSAMAALAGEIDTDLEAEAVRKRDEKEIQNDYNERDGENQGRQIDHLILVTHGIGQRLGMRTESVNFIHDVNVLRKTLKSVYGSSADLQALNSEIDKLPKNCRIQVLPVCWRHLLDFPRKGVRQNRREHDLGDAFGDDEEYPSLEDITVEGVPFVRSLITDLALDILLYQSAYREHIAQLVTAESNRVYDLFLERNPSFSGKVSLIGHSLGSAILFDILCRQKENTQNTSGRHRPRHSSGKSQVKDLDLKFPVEDFYCLGSPVGLFQMLKGRSILGRHQRNDAVPADSPMDPEDMQDPFLGFASGENISSITGLPLIVSSPKAGQLYNIFHPSDPIAYRLEPLIAPAMSSLKPQLLPYTKKTISASVSGIGAKVGQSVSGLWSSLSSGIASSLLNRSLGLTSDDVARMEAPSPQRSASNSLGAGTNISAGGVISHDIPTVPTLQRESTNEKKKALAKETAAKDREGTGANAPTLIDDEIETLYAGFQKRRESNSAADDANKEKEDFSEAEARGRKLRREEAKVRALNSNGRVDYSIQESVLDFNPMNTIASHLSYWADEDVSHFMMSQLLSRHRNAVGTERERSK
ncbi:hypothetical protein VTL71DRAFT_12599 [Oculimacula yallundae]|uniref:DDHD domain-containing protein n=1 Tax=Oculimacula yallundae TaxID=86028 RepID=A0ABR4CMZ3_9HELO